MLNGFSGAGAGWLAVAREGDVQKSILRILESPVEALHDYLEANLTE